MLQGMSSAGDVGSAQDPAAAMGHSSKPRLQSPLDYRNGDLVSRLLAATPPYLYNMPLVPQSFFFSEMLRSFVQAKAEAHSPPAGCSPAPPPRPTRRSRKRSWREGSSERAAKISSFSDKPLELTTTSRPPKQEDSKPPPPASSPSVLPPPPPLLLPPCGLLPLPSPDTTLPPDMLLPPPPPLWYPPLYPLPPQPPYGIDPLHFFIDLRVSGHIWDRKLGDKAGGSSPGEHGLSASGMLATDEKPCPKSPPGPSSLVKQTKHCSAFSVPQPRAAERRETSPLGAVANTSSTNYVLRNLSRIYQELRGGRQDGDDCRTAAVEKEGDQQAEEPDQEQGKARCKDLRALIGLELVVDYVKHEEGPKARGHDAEPVADTSLDTVASDNNHEPMRQL
ncbi:hypothetical protein PR048_015558 [Dryococelus australis]|uniref:Uncharacterized protein n=1 Tax=Dryococelus australis TaxID=614101 RepID=A0ABQ9HHJ3_9NEOP|nr:hypothetical protein PR048_015558 [Dryococelus australis]